MIKSGLILPYKQSRSLPREKYRKNWIFCNYVGDFWGRAKGLPFVAAAMPWIQLWTDKQLERLVQDHRISFCPLKCLRQISKVPLLGRWHYNKTEYLTHCCHNDKNKCLNLSFCFCLKLSLMLYTQFFVLFCFLLKIWGGTLRGIWTIKEMTS